MQTSTEFREMASADYHADYSAVSKSMLSVFRKRRSVYKAIYLDRTRKRESPSRQMDIGTLAHSMLLEPENLERDLVVYPQQVLAKDGQADTNRAKAFRVEQESLGRTCLLQDDFRSVRKMCESVKRVCGQWLEHPAYRERSVYWRDVGTDLRLKCRPDWVIDAGETVFAFDLKTTGDASPTAFSLIAGRFEYPLQAVHYSAGLREAIGKPVEWHFIVVETEEPFSCALYRVKPSDLLKAERQWRNTLCDLKACIDKDDWREPWELGEINDLELKPWALE